MGKMPLFGKAHVKGLSFYKTSSFSATYLLVMLVYTWSLDVVSCETGTYLSLTGVGTKFANVTEAVSFYLVPIALLTHVE